MLLGFHDRTPKRTDRGAIELLTYLTYLYKKAYSQTVAPLSVILQKQCLARLHEYRKK
jgi:hypothetical protein